MLHDKRLIQPERAQRIVRTVARWAKLPTLAFLPRWPVRGKGLTMKQLVGFAGMLLASSAGAGQPGHVAVHSTTVTRTGEVTVGYSGAAGLICQTSARDKLGPKLVVTITPSKVKIIDTSKKGTPLAAVAVRWSNGAPFTGKVRLTKNPGGICQLADMELQLGRDTRKADDYTTSVCTVTATK